MVIIKFTYRSVLQTDRLAAEVLWRDAQSMLSETEPFYWLIQVFTQQALTL